MRAPALVLLIVALTGFSAVAQEVSEETETAEATSPGTGFRDATNNTGRLVSSIVTIDREALFVQSEFGQRIQKELEQDTEALAAENRRIEGELIAEEKELTVRRATISVEEFTPLAEAFDQKVQRIRNEQDQKSILLQQRLDQQRQTFLGSVSPILGEIAQSRGAVAVLDRNSGVVDEKAIQPSRHPGRNMGDARFVVVDLADHPHIRRHKAPLDRHGGDLHELCRALAHRQLAQATLVVIA